MNLQESWNEKQKKIPEDKQQWRELLKKAGISKFEVKDYTESLSDKGDTTQSGNLEFVLTEIYFE